MKEIFYNDDNLTQDDIDETVTRVKAIILNDNNDILLGYCNHTYQFPGGHLNQNESLTNGLIREVKEESGITLNHIDNPFLLIRYYSKNYRNKNINRENKIYYYKVHTNELPNYDEMDLDEYEKNNNYQIVQIPLDKFDDILSSTLESNDINKIIYKEMQDAINLSENV